MDLFGVRQTLERAKLFVGEKRRFEVKDIETVSAGTGSHNVFNLLDAIAASDLRKSLATVTDLFSTGDKTPMWLSAIFTHYAQLFEAHGLPAEISDHEAAAQLGTKPYFVKKRKQEAGLYGAVALEHALNAAYETECLIRTSRMPPRLAFELLVYRLCRRRHLKQNTWIDLESPVSPE
jgi:DNA polymerase III delta subunit